MSLVMPLPFALMTEMLLVWENTTLLPSFE